VRTVCSSVKGRGGVDVWGRVGVVDGVGGDIG
jgi:hypothetical protein